MTEPIRQYRPLTGEETVDYLLAEFRKALVNSGQFPLHRAFHELRFVGGVKVNGWGSREAKVNFSGQRNGEHSGEEFEVKVAIEAEAEPPSLVRERLAEPIVPMAATEAMAEQGEEEIVKLQETADANACTYCFRPFKNNQARMLHERRWCKEKP